MVFDTATGQETLTLDGPRGSFDHVVFSPDGKRLVAGGLEVKVWNAATGPEILRTHKESVGGVAFSPDGKRLAFLTRDAWVKVRCRHRQGNPFHSRAAASTFRQRRELQPGRRATRCR